MEKIIGKNVVRVDGYEKVTGKAIYGDDIQLPKMLYAACRYADISAGKIKSLDVSKAKKMPGVEKIALYDDVMGQTKVGPIRADYLPIVKDEVYFSGDVIAVVAAKTKEQANNAADAIEVQYEEFEVVSDIEEAIKEESRLVHPEYKSNVMVHYPVRKGDVDKGFSESENVIERTYRTGFHEHAYIEPETVTVEPDHTTKGLKIYGSIQNPHTTRHVVSIYTGLKLNQINVKCSALGGSFGGKDDVINNMACRLAVLALKTDKPVQMTYSRENSLKESYKRHPYVMNYKVGFNNDGKLKSMKIDVLADCGAYSSQTFFVTWRSVVQATGPYEIENVMTDVRGVYTNNTYTAAFRGFGSPQVIFAQESLMDEIAKICNISPLEIRKINGFKQGSVTASGQVLEDHKVSLNQVIDEAVEKSNYKEKFEKYKKFNKESERYKYGIGLAASFRGCALGAEGTDASSAVVSVQADGSVIVITGVNENGQGLRTTMCQFAAEEFGIDLDWVNYLEPQTSAVADGGPTVASRGTIAGGNAVLDAVNKIKMNIFSVIKDDLQVNRIEDTIWSTNKITSLKNEDLSISFKEACAKAAGAGVNISAYGWWHGPDVSWKEEVGQGNAYFTYVYGCQIADVVVDTYTGKLDVKKITAAHDVGKVINKLGIEGQVYGGVTQGFGYGVLEDYNIQNGKVKSLNFDNYLIPTIKDIGEIEPILIENPDVNGPKGAKSIGEPTLELGAAAINNAHFAAVNKRSYRIPLTLEQVFLGKNLRKPSRQSEKGLSSKKKKQTLRVNNLEIKTPNNLKEALNIYKEGNFQFIAGGTDVIVQLRHTTKEKKLIDISRLEELKHIEVRNNEIIIGAGVKFSEIIYDENIFDNYPLLIKACSSIGSNQIRNRATIGGNIANAAPCADSVPPLVLYNAKLRLESFENSRIVDIKDFINWPYNTILNDDEIITEIILPRPVDLDPIYSYFQLGRRNAVNITRMSISGQISLDDEKKIKEIRLVDGALFSKPQRLSEIEEMFIGKELTKELIVETLPVLENKITDAIGKRWSAEYKLPVFMNVYKDFMKELRKKVIQRG